MSQVRPTKAITITNDEIYDLAGHMARLGDSLRVVIPVVNLAEQTALAAAFGGTLPIPTFVSRADLNGTILRWNGSRWAWVSPYRHGKNRQAAVTVAGDIYQTLCTVNATTLGGFCEIKYDGILANANSGAARTADVQILLDDVPISGITYAMPLVSGADAPYSVSFSFDTASAPAAGAHVFKLQTRGSAASAIRNQQMTLTVSEQP